MCGDFPVLLMPGEIKALLQWRSRGRPDPDFWSIRLTFFLGAALATRVAPGGAK